jgi:hypothetical protein
LHQAPPSKTILQIQSNVATWFAVVGLIDPNGFALGAASGKFNDFNSARVSGWFGTLTATKFFPSCYEVWNNVFFL